MNTVHFLYKWHRWLLSNFSTSVLKITQNNPSSFYLSSRGLFSIPLIFLLVFYGPASFFLYITPLYEISNCKKNQEESILSPKQVQSQPPAPQIILPKCLAMFLCFQISLLDYFDRSLNFNFSV